MPLIHVNMIEGRSEAQKADMIRGIAEAVSVSLDAPIDTVRILIHELPSANWGIGPVNAKSKGR